MQNLVIAAVLVLVGCSKASKDKPEPGATGDQPGAAATSGPTCAEAAAKAVGALPAGSDAGEVQTKLTAILTTRCTEDRWPAATIECYATQVKDMMGMRTCRETLPPEHQQKMMTEIRTVMMGAAGAGGGPMHGTPAADPTAPAPAP
ncbi:MAG: hypothetical protein M3680_17865 [Myxococcota bacterium]|nr:hypothetical protein [Myxococcota bacterium]